MSARRGYAPDVPAVDSTAASSRTTDAAALCPRTHRRPLRGASGRGIRMGGPCLRRDGCDAVAVPALRLAARRASTARAGSARCASGATAMCPTTSCAPPRVDVVYYLRFGDRVKIGTSSQSAAAIRGDLARRGPRVRARRPDAGAPPPRAVRCRSLPGHRMVPAVRRAARAHRGRRGGRRGSVAPARPVDQRGATRCADGARRAAASVTVTV